MINLLGWAPVTVRSDVEDILKSKWCQDLFKKYGMKWESAAAYTKEQDETSECSIQTIIEWVWFMIIDSSLPHELWKEAFITTINLENMSPTSTELFGCIVGSYPTTSYKAFHGSQPTARWIHCWSCDAWLYDKTNKKIAPLSKWMIFIEFEGNINYWLWDPEIRKIIVSSHVKFDEGFDIIQSSEQQSPDEESSNEQSSEQQSSEQQSLKQ